ncbi:hypothetical protein CDD81_2171 [Ophiocordyceps australis]|uniref:Uncharacterized protein n=1 Tax=Ophiocordyceps australis TaxID=1399860 RepID=A0A2C5XYL0_9HYPO|nr:hypothetical protein CDD81_2171 [Ophiocordyceps australis]
MPQKIGSIWKNSHRVNKTRRKATGASLAGRKEKTNKDLFADGLTDAGTVEVLEDDLTLRDVVQAMRHIRRHMFVALPRSGLAWSTRTSEVLHYRAAMPPLVAPGHVHAVLAGTAPARLERETAELVSKGTLRRIRVDRGHGRDNGAGAGEALVEAADLERLVKACPGVGHQTADAFVTLLRAKPRAQAIDTASDASLTDAQTNELLRAGFLTSDATRRTRQETLGMRPEDRTTLTSLQSVSRYASGTLSAVGGHDAIHLAGGSGGGIGPSMRRLGAPSPPGGHLRIAVPGHGRFTKLADAAVDWLRDALGCTRWGEAPEQWLRERFEADGGIRSPRWRDFWGLEWPWLLGHAVGLGAVELFDTGSVGRGVRALGG